MEKYETNLKTFSLRTSEGLQEVVEHGGKPVRHDGIGQYRGQAFSHQLQHPDSLLTHQIMVPREGYIMQNCNR